MVLLATLRAVDRRRGEVARAIDREQIMVIKIGKPLQSLATLQLGEQRLVERTKCARIKPIEAFAKTRVAGRTLHAVECLEIRPRRFLLAVMLELQQRRILQPEQRQPRHQIIHQPNVIAGGVGDLPEYPPRRLQQAGSTQLFADQRRTHQNLPHSLNLARQYTDFSLKVYEELFSSPI